MQKFNVCVYLPTVNGDRLIWTFHNAQSGYRKPAAQVLCDDLNMMFCVTGQHYHAKLYGRED